MKIFFTQQITGLAFKEQINFRFRHYFVITLLGNLIFHNIECDERKEKRWHIIV